MDDLKEKAAQLPQEPGVYLFKDDKDVVLYIGKAKSLRSRVLSYFRKNLPDPKIEKMIAQAVDVEIVRTDSEVDALLAESRLIKDIQPKYNRSLKDDKTHPFIEITREDFPRVTVTREPARSSRLYGPFVDALGLKKAFSVLQRVFMFRTCTLDISAEDDKRRFRRPCLLYFIKMCTGPCADLVSRKDYLFCVKQFERFLRGRTRQVFAALERRMLAESRAQHYEEAARVRDQIFALRSLDRRSRFTDNLVLDALAIDPAQGARKVGELLGFEAPARTIEGVDVATISGADSVGSVVYFIDGKPFKQGYRRYKIKGVEGVDDYAMIREVVFRRYRRIREEETPVADVLLIDGGPGQLNAAVSALEELGIRPKAVLALAKREELIYIHGRKEPLALPARSPALRLLQYVRDEAHRFASHYHHILRSRTVRLQRRRTKKARAAKSDENSNQQNPDGAET